MCHLKLELELILEVLVKVPALALPTGVHTLMLRVSFMYGVQCGVIVCTAYCVPLLSGLMVNQSLSFSLLILMY